MMTASYFSICHCDQPISPKSFCPEFYPFSSGHPMSGWCLGWNKLWKQFVYERVFISTRSRVFCKCSYSCSISLHFSIVNNLLSKLPQLLFLFLNFGLHCFSVSNLHRCGVSVTCKISWCLPSDLRVGVCIDTTVIGYWWCEGRAAMLIAFGTGCTGFTGLPVLMYMNCFTCNFKYWRGTKSECCK